MNKKTNKISLCEAKQAIITMQKKINENKDVKNHCKHIDILANVLLKKMGKQSACSPTP